MRQMSWSDPAVKGALGAVRGRGPFVYGLTNYVAATLSANVLLAVGAGPAIGAAPGWPGTFGATADALWINGAALMSSSPETLTAAAAAARAARKPWVLDPVAVGAGAVSYDEILRALLAHNPSVIRGNASELMALAGHGASGKGVETTAGSEDAVAAIEALARQTGAVVAVSGATDFISDGTQTIAVAGGDRRLTQVTGAGCSLGALIAAVLAAVPDRLEATAAAHAFYAVAAERASAARGTASFATAFVDELSLLDAGA